MGAVGSVGSCLLYATFGPIAGCHCDPLRLACIADRACSSPPSAAGCAGSGLSFFLLTCCALGSRMSAIAPDQSSIFSSVFSVVLPLAGGFVLCAVCGSSSIKRVVRDRPATCFSRRSLVPEHRAVREWTLGSVRWRLRSPGTCLAVRAFSCANRRSPTMLQAYCWALAVGFVLLSGTRPTVCRLTHSPFLRARFSAIW